MPYDFAYMLVRGMYRWVSVGWLSKPLMRLDR